MERYEEKAFAPPNPHHGSPGLDAKWPHSIDAGSPYPREMYKIYKIVYMGPYRVTKFLLYVYKIKDNFGTDLKKNVAHWKKYVIYKLLRSTLKKYTYLRSV